MKAAFIKQYGGIETLQLGQLPKPQPERNQVLIRVAASAVNPVDFHLRNGMMADTGTHTLPVVLGWDCSGVVEQVGEGVDSLQVGDKVLAFTPISEQGTNAEFVAVDAELVVEKPAELSFVEAAALPLAAVTAWQGLHRHGRLAQGKTVLIHNASGAVGSYAVQIAKAAGAYVVATASATKLDYVTSLGADEVFNERDLEWQSSNQYDVAYVAKPGIELLAESACCVKSGGSIVSTFDEIAEQQVATHGISFTRMWVENSAADLEQLVQLVKEKAVKIPIDSVYPLEEIQTAHLRSEQHKAVGKIVLVVDPLLKY